MHLLPTWSMKKKHLNPTNLSVWVNLKLSFALRMSSGCIYITQVQTFTTSKCLSLQCNMAAVVTTSSNPMALWKFLLQCTQNFAVFAVCRSSVLHYWVTRVSKTVALTPVKLSKKRRWRRGGDREQYAQRVFCHCQTLLSLLAEGTMIYGGVSML